MGYGGPGETGVLSGCISQWRRGRYFQLGSSLILLFFPTFLTRFQGDRPILYLFTVRCFLFRSNIPKLRFMLIPDGDEFGGGSWKRRMWPGGRGLSDDMDTWVGQKYRA